MPAPFRLAFLGIDNPHGHGWRELLRQFGGEIEIVAIVPGLGGRLTSLEEYLAHVPRFDDLPQLLAGTEFDGAVVCLPNDAAPAACTALAQAGKHLLVEKPCAGSAESFCPVAAAVRTSGVAFQAGYMWRYDECAARLREMVLDGRFGRHISTEVRFVTSDVQRRDSSHYLFDPAVSQAGFFNWLACHSLDLLFYILQQPVVGVTSRVGVFGGTPVEVEDGGVALLDLADGSLATFLGGYWIPRWAGESHWCLRGSERWVDWDPGRKGTSGVLEIHGPMPQWLAMEETFSTPADTTPGYGGARGRALVRDWLDAARSGRTDCRNTPESVLATLDLIDTIYRASRDQRRIECRIGG